MGIVDAAIADDEGLPPLRPDAIIVAGATRRGKPCRLIDNTCSQPKEVLEDLLNDLIAQDHFGPGGFTAAGGNTITLGVPQSAHVQLGEDIYRLIVFDYEARIESF